MKSQHLSAQPGPASRAGPPCSRQGTLLRHSLFTGTNHGWTLAPPLESLPPGSQASQVHAPTAQPSPCEDGPVSTCCNEGLDRPGHRAHRAAGPTPSLQPSDPQTSGLSFARDPQREAQKAKHPCPWLQTPRPPPGQSGASMPEPPQAAIAISPTHTPSWNTGTQGIPENLGTGRAKDHTALGLTTGPWRSAPMGSDNPTHQGLPSPPAPGIPTRSR